MALWINSEDQLDFLAHGYEPQEQKRKDHVKSMARAILSEYNQSMLADKKWYQFWK